MAAGDGACAIESDCAEGVNLLHERRPLSGDSERRFVALLDPRERVGVLARSIGRGKPDRKEDEPATSKYASQNMALRWAPVGWARRSIRENCVEQNVDPHTDARVTVS